MRLALEQARQTLVESEYPVGAIVVFQGEVIGQGRKMSTDFHMGHAEMQALSNALYGKRYRREDELTIYTTLEPCVMCFGTILNCPVTKVVYAMEDVYGGATNIPASSLPVRHLTKKPEIVSGVLREESRTLLKNFLNVTQDPFWLNPDNPLVQEILK